MTYSALMGQMNCMPQIALPLPACTVPTGCRVFCGALKLLYWQAVTLLNPHFAIGTKDQEGARIFYEPLAGWDGEGNLVPFLAAEIPSKDNGGLTEDGLSVIWKLKQGVKWHDGMPFTADDVVFNWEYAKTPETAAVTTARPSHETLRMLNFIGILLQNGLLEETYDNS